jgi:alanine dehydrogenase
MTLLLDTGDIERLHGEGIVTMADHVAAIESAYRSLGEGGAQVMPRFNLQMDPNGDPKSKSLKVGGATLPAAGMMGSALYSAGFNKGRIELWVVLYSTETGQLAGLVRGQSVSLWKTGATAAVAAKHMARPDAAVVGMIGTGRYARTQLTGLMAVRPIRELRCFSRTADARADFVAWAARECPQVAVTAAETARAATEGVDILVTVTTAREPVTDGRWISPGTHVSAVGAHYPEMREVDTETVRRSRVVVDDIAQAFQEKGEILIPLKEGAIGRDHILGDLGAVVAGKLAARRTSEDVTLFCSGGVPIEYMGSCGMLLERARQAGIGQTLSIA